MILFVVLLSACFARALGPIGPPMAAEMKKVELCPDTDDLAIELNHVYCYKADKHYQCEGEVTVTKEISGPIEIKVTALKCQKEGEHCEIYTVYDGNGCQQLEEKKGAFYKLMLKTGSNISECPIQPTDVDFKNMTLDVPENMAQVASTISHSWKVVFFATGTVDGELQTILCTNVLIKIEEEKGEERKRTFG